MNGQGRKNKTRDVSPLMRAVTQYIPAANKNKQLAAAARGSLDEDVAAVNCSDTVLRVMSSTLGPGVRQPFVMRNYVHATPRD